MPCYILMPTLVPCAVMRCYRDCGNHRHDDITSAFRIDYAPLQIFEVIKPGLWCAVPLLPAQLAVR